MVLHPAQELVISGIGWVSALGASVAQAWPKALKGCDPFVSIPYFPTEGERSSLGAPADFPPCREQLPFPLSRTDQMALHAVREAISLSGLSPEQLSEAGLFLGGGTGGLHVTENHFRAWLLEQKPLDLQDFLVHNADVSAQVLAHALGLQGPLRTVMTACSSSLVAMADATDQLLADEIPLALVGGADSITRLTHAGFNSLGAVDPAPCRPFDAQRAGMNLGECAAFMVLEKRAHAQARGARILCRLSGIGLSCDAHHMTAPPPDGHGAVRAMRQALCDACLEPGDIDLVNAHATATPQNDQAELHALQTVFLPRERALAVTGTKSMTGHCLGAAGACEAVLTILSLVHQHVPPTIHSQSSILSWPLQLVQEPESAWSLRHAMSNSFAFGGNNGSVIFSL